MKAEHFVAHLSDLMIATDKQPWYLRAAFGCIAAGHVQFITQRRSDDLYLVRMWLTPPKPKQSTDDAGPFESGGSVLLHWFACGDDDQALHDHPWAFATTILAGGYWEHLPPADWKGPLHGPIWDQCRVWRGVGAEVVHGCGDLHCVSDPLPDTFTLVRTGARIRDWGFHPEGRPWVNHSVYLDRSTIAGAAHV